MMKLKKVRETFLNYFVEKGHTRVPSSSLVPSNDPTLMFTNAGMVQFKNIFTGEEPAHYKRATSSQRCVRLSGKHNDLENVGFTGRHHTFFEMLGNFSFGDYFKSEAIALAWEFVTKVIKLKTSHLYVSIFEDDDEAEKIWIKIGVPKDRIFRFGTKDNFWAMGETGPCGPCSEIFWDMGKEVGCGRPTCTVGCDCDRYQEIWNLVFMQYNRDTDGNLTPLPKPSIDTGAGLERLTACLQGVHSNYEIDHFQTLISAVGHITQVKYGDSHDTDVSLQVVADHLRAMVFLIADGVLPSNEGRGYVLRRIMRRALRHGKKLGMEEPFIFRLTDILIDEMEEAYPELSDKRELVQKVVRSEEERFLETLDSGMRIYNDEIKHLKATKKKVLPGDIVFKLYDTFGFPPDLTRLMAKEDGLSINEEEFNSLMETQREKGRKAWRGSGSKKVGAIYQEIASKTTAKFTGYENDKAEGTLLNIICNERISDSAKTGDVVELVFDQTPFYGESGGQVGDTGQVKSENATIEITNTLKPLPDLIVHHGRVKSGSIKIGERFTLQVGLGRKDAIRLNHTATHLLHWALRKTLGNHVKQAGSLVEPDRLRFDYTHFENVTPEQLETIEQLINEKITLNSPVLSEETSYKESLKAGAIALFGEKYREKVRMISIGDFSKELCGGTHVSNTGEIRLFVIISDSGIASGVRRIEALTGSTALQFLTESHKQLMRVGGIVRSASTEIPQKLERIIAREKELEREISRLKKEAAKQTASLATHGEIEVINDIQVIATEADCDNPDDLRILADELRNKLKSGIVAVGSTSDTKVFLVISVTKDLTKKFHAGNLIKDIAKEVGGSGGGRPDFAQAGGNDPTGLKRALDKLKDLIKNT